jgi:flagellar biosynthetic protein FliR
MITVGSNALDTTGLWTFFVYFVRIGGVLTVLPGIGTDQWGPQWRLFLSVIIAFGLALTGISSPMPTNEFQMALMITSEFALGFAMGLLPSFVLGGLGVAGQVIAGAIGLGQANMIDRSLGGNTSVISQVKTMLATIIFLSLEGHHVILRAATAHPGELGFGMFLPGYDTAAILTDQLVRSFELALIVSAPVLVATLLTQFVLGLVTKFLPQMNIFIISLPLTLIVGLYLISNTYNGVSDHVISEFTRLEETTGRITTNLRDETAEQLNSTQDPSSKSATRP